MEKGPSLVPSGVEPVDKLCGGLESGRLYLVHGEGPGKSLFGYQFLIEGLKRDEHVALIINYSPEDAVRWFARLGYDCLEDIYNGRLVVLECAEENLNQIARMKELTPVLQELRWLIGEKNPDRVVIEPIGRLIMSEQGLSASRSREFATWASDIGSTSLLIANGRSDELIANLLPLVRESFRFEVEAEAGVPTRYLRFEKSPEIGAQAIEADPSKGIFLIESESTRVVFGAGFDEPRRGAESADSRVAEQTGEYMEDASMEAGPGTEYGIARDPFADLISEIFADEKVDAGSDLHHEEPAGLEAEPAYLAGAPAPAAYSGYRSDQLGVVPAGEGSAESVEEPELAPDPSAHDLDRLEISGMVEDLLRPPPIPDAFSLDSAEVEAVDPSTARESDLSHTDATASEHRHRSVQPSDFNVLVISGNPGSVDRVTKSLSEYHLEGSGDGVSGLARLISFKPDLIVLDIDLSGVDGFEMLRHIRANLDVPIIVLSSSRLRASDRIRSAELGADYYLTQPFSTRELKQKARQLIARYRRIEEWITAPAQSDPRRAEPGEAESPEVDGEDEGDTAFELYARRDARHNLMPARAGETSVAPGPAALDRDVEAREQRGGSAGIMVPYSDFVRRIEAMVEATRNGEAWFSVVGCRAGMGAGGTAADRAEALAQIVPDLIRDCDVASVNEAGDLMILLADADLVGAKAFTARLHEMVKAKLNVEPVTWIRTFPFPNQQDE